MPPTRRRPRRRSLWWSRSAPSPRRPPTRRPSSSRATTGPSRPPFAPSTTTRRSTPMSPIRHPSPRQPVRLRAPHHAPRHHEDLLHTGELALLQTQSPSKESRGVTAQRRRRGKTGRQTPREGFLPKPSKPDTRPPQPRWPPEMPPTRRQPRRRSLWWSRSAPSPRRPPARRPSSSRATTGPLRPPFAPSTTTRKSTPMAPIRHPRPRQPVRLRAPHHAPRHHRRPPPYRRARAMFSCADVRAHHNPEQRRQDHSPGAGPHWPDHQLARLLDHRAGPG
ncbi:hypothetical protein ACQJBY_065690 [Aegilops geniculata]